MIEAMKAPFRFFINRVWYGLVLYGHGIRRHRALVKSADRSQSHTYTCFYRSPGQLDALTEPVMEFILKSRPAGTPLLINVFAGSNGSESYTLASTLRRKFPGLEFRITASDLHVAMVERATAAVYSAAEVHGGGADEQFITDTFEKTDAGYRVRPEIRAHVSFAQASLLDAKLGGHHAPADLNFVQNVFCHLDEKMTREAFANVARCLKPHSALFVDGMDLDLREELTTAAGLEPLNYRLREIHEHARIHIGVRWWTYYYGIEPYFGLRRNRVRRYSTIFFRKG